ncbi:MAG: hypothetical protein WKF89_06945 [Chitinophagaceae bacterium]
MDTEKIDAAIPSQETGAKTDTHHSVTTKSLEEAKELFLRVKDRLQDVNRWNEFCGKASAKFELTDHEGHSVTRKPQKGDHFKINVPAPGTETGDGRDWVMIEEIEDKSDSNASTEAFVIRVRPAQNPETPDHDTAHFFKDVATSSFAVQREDMKVTASVHGRNEVPNIKTENFIDNARNVLVALGAMVGLSNPQWKSLVKGLFEE